MEKVSHEELRDMLREIEISDEKIDKLLDLFDKKLEDYQELSDKNELIKEGVLEILEVNKYLSELGIIDDCRFTPTLARGLSIYTGIVFEFYDKLERLTCAIGAGGRYDKIITNFMDNGMAYPACGLSFGLEPIFYILKESNKDIRSIDMYLVPLDTQVETLKLATLLRSKGYRVLIEMNKKKIGKCFEYAERENIKYVMIIGENEISSQIYKIKDMDEKVEYTFSQDELLEYLANN